MVQLIVNGTTYPEAKHGKYKCYPTDLGEDLRMISGRNVTEIGARIMVIESAYDFIPDPLKTTMLNDLRSRTELEVAYLPDNSNEMQSGTFKCAKLSPPTYAYSKNGIAFWRGLAFTLEGVDGIE
jgi:hypothetical protein